MVAESFVPAFVRLADTFCIFFWALSNPFESEDMSAAIFTTRFLITANCPHPLFDDYSLLCRHCFEYGITRRVCFLRFLPYVFQYL